MMNLHHKLLTNLVLLKIIILLLLFNSLLSKSPIQETEQQLETRIKYFKSFSQTITNGKVTFEYEKDKGFYCKAQTDIQMDESVFKVPKEYILSQCKYKP